MALSHTRPLKVARDFVYLQTMDRFPAPQILNKSAWQCSEICGANHRFIPIVIERVSTNSFINWISNNILCFLSTSTFHIVSCILQKNTICNTPKLAIFSLCAIYVLRLINVLKYEIIVQDRKLAELFWLHFYREAMLPPHPCTLHPWCCYNKLLDG
jgi:hypothetical protein